jgi:CubicO group peptidase (beta-lactamase class C family)
MTDKERIYSAREYSAIVHDESGVLTTAELLAESETTDNAWGARQILMSRFQRIPWCIYRWVSAKRVLASRSVRFLTTLRRGQTICLPIGHRAWAARVRRTGPPPGGQPPIGKKFEVAIAVPQGASRMPPYTTAIISPRAKLPRLGVIGVELLFALSLLAGAASARPREAMPTMARVSMEPLQRLDDAIYAGMARAHLPGISVSLFTPNQILFSRGYGFADLANGREVTESTVFMIASISKVVTGLALMQLAEGKRVSLDSDVNEYLDFSVRNPHFPAEGITVRQLLTHTSSINEAQYDRYWHEGFKSVGDSQIPLREFLQGYLLPGGTWYERDKSWLSIEPGRKWSYSNVGAALVGYLIERISGKPLDVVSDEKIFGPLGMDSCKWRLARIDSSALAVSYVYDVANHRFVAIPADGFPDWPAGMMHCTANDLAKFWMMILNNGSLSGATVVQPGTIREMLSNQLSVGQGPFQGLMFEDPEDEGWKLAPQGIPRQERIHAGVYIIGHLGGDDGVATAAVIDTHSRIGVVFLANGAWGPESTPFIQSVVARLLDIGRLIPKPKLR